MLSLDLALALRDAGVVWQPAPGDAFVVPDRDLDEHVFVLSDMVVQTVQPPEGPPILAFNGTTEWALDSLEAHEAVWLPREDQLRALLGRAFVRLERVPGPPEGYAVTVGMDRFLDVTPEAAYARALLATLP
ncbi:MAG TPA: pilus assembly protein CpaE [Nocardioides bacterium]|uniref:pilus assembly protein CpaE n=1 Tax=uncultured Nocardioides sp. TaxID=198441 RepID=UPI000ED53696|nr:pilus assembly protein CpaE [uncultured Nocardioides sp.]HCB04760.1 pilus assembly protein CpaE [Nocardioides sp.]HRD64385.1 pilus assembly protein CpaE [Nocardioides sp.]